MLFSDVRFLTVNGLHLSQVSMEQCVWLCAYFCLILVIIVAAYKELDLFQQSEGSFSLAQSNVSFSSAALIVGRKLLLGLLVIAVVIAIYSLYCLRFYPAR